MQATIRNEMLTLTVDTHGAEAVSLKNQAGEEMLWCGDPAVWARHAPILFPWTGKLVGGAFTHNGKTYKGGQHGFARDVEHTLISAEGDTLVMELRSGPETAERFPFAFTLTTTYRLEGRKVHLSLAVTNDGDAPMPFGIGFHPAFAIPFDGAHRTGDYEFRFEHTESPLVIDAMPDGLVNGKCYYLGANIDKVPLTDRLFDNDSFCMTNLTSRTLGIYEKDTGRHITSDIADFPYTLIWSARTETCRFVCIEPWRSLPGVAGGSQEWADRAAACILAPGQTDVTTLTTEFAR